MEKTAGGTGGKTLRFVKREGRPENEDNIWFDLNEIGWSDLGEYLETVEDKEAVRWDISFDEGRSCANLLEIKVLIEKIGPKVLAELELKETEDVFDKNYLLSLEECVRFNKARFWDNSKREVLAEEVRKGAEKRSQEELKRMV